MIQMAVQHSDGTFDRCFMLRLLLLFIIEHVVHDVSGEHVLIDVSLHDKEHITQPASQPPPLSA